MMLDTLRGLVRPVVTLLLTGAFTVGFLTGKVAVEVFVPVVLLVLNWWFESRTNTPKTPVS